MASVVEANSAYSAALKALQKPSAADTGTAPSAVGGGFGDLLKQSLQSAVDAQHRSEAVSTAALAGKADMTDVLQAITGAEMALNAVLAIRDKVVQAYEQVMRTPV